VVIVRKFARSVFLPAGVEKDRIDEPDTRNSAHIRKTSAPEVGSSVWTLGVEPIRMRLRYLWTLPNTLLGLALALLSRREGDGARWVDGVLEIHGPGVRRLFNRLGNEPLAISAVTLGHVVLARDRRSLHATRRHERTHVEQYERWGPFFLPAYLAAALIAVCQGRDPYLENRFERMAAGGDCGRPRREHPSRRSGKTPAQRSGVAANPGVGRHALRGCSAST